MAVTASDRRRSVVKTLDCLSIKTHQDELTSVKQCAFLNSRIRLTSRVSANSYKSSFTERFRCRRERRVFEKYQKAARAMPDKKERDEIEALRAQVKL